MANLWDIIIDAANESETGTPSATTIPSITEYVRWCNKGQDIIATATGCLEQLNGFPTVGDQIEYILPGNVIKPQVLEWVQASMSKRRLFYKDISEFRKLVAFNYVSGTPNIYSLYGGNRLMIHPPVANTSGQYASTTTVGAATGVTDTSITVASTTGFAKSGRIRINTSATVWEDIDYTSTTATSFTGCVRGCNGTTATSYTNQTVTEVDLLVWSTVRYLTRPYFIWTTGTANVTNTGTPTNVAAGSTAPLWTGNVYPGMQFGIGTNPSKWYDISAVSATPTLTIATAYAETTATNKNYVIAPLVDLKTEWYDVLVKYLLFRTLKRKELHAEAQACWVEFNNMMQDLKSATTDRNDDEYPVIHDVDLFEP